VNYDSQLRKTGAASLSPPSKGNSGFRHPREKSRGDAPSPAQWGAAKDQHDGRRMNSNGREVRLSEKSRDAATARSLRSPARNGPYGVNSRDTAPSAGGLPAHQMVKRDEKQEAATGDGAGVLLFSFPTLAKIHSSPTLTKKEGE